MRLRIVHSEATALAHGPEASVMIGYTEATALSLGPEASVMIVGAEATALARDRVRVGFSDDRRR